MVVCVWRTGKPRSCSWVALLYYLTKFVQVYFFSGNMISRLRLSRQLLKFNHVCKVIKEVMQSKKKPKKLSIPLKFPRPRRASSCPKAWRATWLWRNWAQTCTWSIRRGTRIWDPSTKNPWERVTTIIMQLKLNTISRHLRLRGRSRHGGSNFEGRRRISNSSGGSCLEFILQIVNLP